MNANLWLPTREKNHGEGRQWLPFNDLGGNLSGIFGHKMAKTLIADMSMGSCRVRYVRKNSRHFKWWCHDETWSSMGGQAMWKASDIRKRLKYSREIQQENMLHTLTPMAQFNNTQVKSKCYSSAKIFPRLHNGEGGGRIVAWTEKETRFSREKRTS